jgi:hypothetical protein
MTSTNFTENEMSAGETHMGFAIKNPRRPGIHVWKIVLQFTEQVLALLERMPTLCLRINSRIECTTSRQIEDRKITFFDYIAAQWFPD